MCIYMSHAWYMYRSENSLWDFSLLFGFQGLRLLGLVASAFTHRATPLALNFIRWWAILVFMICAVGDFSQSFDYLWPNHFSLVDFKSYHLACSITISYITIRLFTYFHFIVHTFYVYLSLYLSISFCSLFEFKLPFSCIYPKHSNPEKFCVIVIKWYIKLEVI